MSGLKIDQSTCIGCGKCVRACSSHGLEVREKKAYVTDSCTLCGICVESCPVQAITLERESAVSEDLVKESKDIWVFAQQSQNEILPVAFELLGKGRELADAKGCRLVAVLGEKEERGNVDRLIAGGADAVIFCQDARLAEPNAEVFTSWICGLIRQFRPEIFLFGATSFGRELAPGIAVRMQTGLTADCTVLEMDAESGLLRQTRPAFGGNLMATIICPNHRPQMATVRAGILSPLTPDPSRKGERIETFLEAQEETHIKILETIPQSDSDSITDAQVLVVVGRGIGSQKNLPLMKRFAELIGGKLGCSRPLVEAGWCEYKAQVGQTGSSVAPKLLFSIGVSGAIQHLAGIGGAETIVAINSDPSAPIFGVSHYSVVGDCVEIVKELVEELSSES
ncbi:FAD-binding protein [Hominifimenecus sp. rT4P-3]|uniref:FAD-binding protein n=1 Tax=Hominifimenecus sp. rT4P-3 TaxID=3242979 RepID=UPI003DA45F33